MRGIRSRSLVIVGTLMAGLLSGTVAPAAAAQATGPRHYYLSLGDSLGFGLQLTRFFAMLNAGTYTPDAFNTGYTDDLAATIRARLRPDLSVVNYSCPAEGTSDMISEDPDACFFHSLGIALHDEYTGSQLGAAVAFLHAHPGQVSPITVSIGGADLSNAIDTCAAQAACVARSGVFATLRANMTTILGQLRAAAPRADIVLLIPHNITIADFPNDNPLWAAFDLEMRTLAVANHARVADAFAGITLTGRTCELTFLCLTGDEMDSHPTDAGYAVMAQLIFHAAGYDRL